MMKLFLALVLFYLFCVNNSRKLRKKNRIESCSTNPAFGSKQFKYFSVSTLYKYAKHQLPTISKRTSKETCSPIYFHLLTRHGARLPSRAFAKKIRNLLTLIPLVNMTGKAKQCSADLKALHDWEPWFDDFVNMNQTEYGDSEIRGIARRFANLLPELFPPRASPASYRYLSTDTERTIQSMRIYGEEILKRGRTRDQSIEEAMSSSNFQVVSDEEDEIIRFQKKCRKYDLEVIKEPSKLTEYRTFMNGSIMRRLIRNVASRLGIKRKILTPELIFNIWDAACRHQQWADTINGPWCFPFSKKELQVMDYAYELSLNGIWRFSIPVTKKMSCNLVKDVVSSIKEAAEARRAGRFYPMGTLRFAHVTPILSTLSNFGILKDPTLPLTASNYRIQLKRKYSTSSRTIPSAGNLAFVLYKCGSDYKVQIFWNEKLVKVPACADDPKTSTLCPLDKVLRFYQDFVPGSPTECDFDEICENEA